MKRVFLVLITIVFSLGIYAQPKYVFYFIGDGMGFNHVRLTQMYLAELQEKIGCEPLVMTSFPVVGIVATHSSSNPITDSAAAGTALATGKKTANGVLGLDDENEEIYSIADTLKKIGWSVGVSTSVSIDHATPGAFYAHVTKRSKYFKIGTQLADSDFDFFAGSSFLKPVGKVRKDSLCLYDLCEQKGYAFARGYENAQELLDTNKLILIDYNDGLTPSQLGKGRLAYGIEKQDTDLTLAKIVSTGVEFLSKKEKPFFFMVEGGSIDRAAHSNDAKNTIGEVLEFDSAIAVAYNFYQEHPDETLILVTADHETGGLALGKKKQFLNLKVLQNQKVSVDSLNNAIKELHAKLGAKIQYKNVQELLTKYLGFYTNIAISKENDALLQEKFNNIKQNKDKNVKTLYSEVYELSNLAIKMINEQAFIGWTTTSHSANPVPLFAVGNGAENFGGCIDNSFIANKLTELLCPPLPQDSTIVVETEE